MKVHAITLLPWLRANLGKRCLAPLAGSDMPALLAAVQIIHLYAETQDHKLAYAFRLAVDKMQESTREMAYHAIAHVMEWEDRSRLWEMAELPPIPHPMLCQYEPAARYKNLPIHIDEYRSSTA